MGLVYVSLDSPNINTTFISLAQKNNNPMDIFFVYTTDSLDLFHKSTCKSGKRRQQYDFQIVIFQSRGLRMS